jgi:hypothetical protein
VSLPELGAPVRARIFLPAGSMWLYETPDRQSAQTGDVEMGMAVSWYPASRTYGKLQDWYYVKSEHGEGWLPSLFGNIEFAPIPPLNSQATALVRDELNEALRVLAQTVRGLADWLDNPQSRKGVFA